MDQEATVFLKQGLKHQNRDAACGSVSVLATVV